MFYLGAFILGFIGCVVTWNLADKILKATASVPNAGIVTVLAISCFVGAIALAIAGKVLDD